MASINIATPTHYFLYGDTWVRCYGLTRMQHHRDVHVLPCPPGPYAWYAFGLQAALINCDDLPRSEIDIHSPPSLPSDPIFTNNQPREQEQLPYEYEPIDETYLIDEVTNESFEEAATHHQVKRSGLTKNIISKNLQVTKYCQEEEEESEICVVCQTEFESSESVAVLRCNHRYHPRCIAEWLVRQNVCPICKGQGLSV